MTEAHLLAGEELERLVLRAGATCTGLMGGDVPHDRPLWLFEILLQAYPDHDADSVMARIEALVADHGHTVRRVIEDHPPAPPTTSRPGTGSMPGRRFCWSPTWPATTPPGCARWRVPQTMLPSWLRWPMS